MLTHANRLIPLRSVLLLAAVLLVTGAAAGAASAIAISASGSAAVECAPLTPDAYVNDPTLGTTQRGPAGTKANPYESGVTLVCDSTSGGPWTLAVGQVESQQSGAELVVDITYLGTHVGTPQAVVQIAAIDEDGRQHPFAAAGRDALEPGEHAALTYTTTLTEDVEIVGLAVTVSEGPAVYFGRSRAGASD